MPLKLRPSEVHGDAGAQCGALYCPRRFRFDLDEAKGRVVGTFPLAPSRQAYSVRSCSSKPGIVVQRIQQLRLLVELPMGVKRATVGGRQRRWRKWGVDKPSSGSKERSSDQSYYISER